MGKYPKIPSNDFQTISVKKGKHDPVFDLFRGYTLKQEIRATIKFIENSRYIQPVPSEQWDWIKLLGLYSLGVHFPITHFNHAMLGGRYIPKEDVWHVGPYIHVSRSKGKHMGGEYAFRVPIGDSVDVRLLNDRSTVLVEIQYEGKSHLTKYKKKKRQLVVVNKYMVGWFGGTLPAPNDVEWLLRVNK